MEAKLSKLFSNPVFWLAEFVLFFIVTNALIQLTPKIFLYRNWVFLFGIFYILVTFKVLSLNPKEMGLTLENLRPALKWLIIPTIITVIVLLMTHMLNENIFRLELVMDDYQGRSLGGIIYEFAFYNLISVPMQELMFRGYYIPRLERVSNNKYFVIIAASITFMLIHYAFDNPFFMIGSLFLGFVYNYNFLKYRNLFALILSHAIIGTVLSIMHLDLVFNIF